MMLLPYILSPLGRIGGTLLIALIAWFGFARHYEKKGAEKIITKIERAADVKVKKADRARQSVSSVPIERLRDPYLRDE